MTQTQGFSNCNRFNFSNDKFELLGMAIQGPTCGDKQKIDLNKMMDESSSEEHKENKIDSSSSSSEDLTDDELKSIGDELEKVVTPEQKTHAMKILGAFRKGTSESEKNAAMVSVSTNF